MSLRVPGCAIAVLLLVGCGIPLESTSRELPGLEVADVAPTTTTTSIVEPIPETTAPAARGALVYLIRGQGIVVRAVVLSAGYAEADLLQLLVDGPSEVDPRGEVRSGLAQRADLVEGLVLEAETIQVDLSPLFADLPGSEQVLILGQLTLTLLANLRADGVVFRQNAQVVAVPDANGQPLSRPATRADYITLLTRA